MQIQIEAPLVALSVGEVLTLDDAAGTRIQSRFGTLWVTEENDASDHIVHSGDALVLSRGGRTVIQALQPAWICLARQ